MKHLVRILLSFVIIITGGLWINVSAQGHAAAATGTSSIPESFSVEEKSVCSGHNYFYQVSAREDGCYAVYYRQANETSMPQGTFGVAYIDLFDADGIFQKELIFSTPHSFAMEYKSDCINLYFYDHLISYDLFSKQLSSYPYPGGWATESGLTKELKKDVFVAGQWHYRCKSANFEYVKLTRENEVGTQVLLSLPGSGFNAGYAGFAAVILAALWFVLFRKLRRKR